VPANVPTGASWKARLFSNWPLPIAMEPAKVQALWVCRTIKINPMLV